MSDLDQHLATIDELLAGNTRPIFDENNPDKQLPEPADAVLYRSAPGTRDKAMDLKPRIDMSKFAMPIFGQVDMNGDPVTRAPGAPPLAVLGGRGMAKMMDRSPPELAMSRFPNRATPDDGGNDGSTPTVSGSDDGSTQSVSTWGEGDLPTRKPAPQGDDMVSLLRNLFQGAL